MIEFGKIQLFLKIQKTQLFLIRKNLFCVKILISFAVGWLLLFFLTRGERVPKLTKMCLPNTKQPHLQFIFHFLFSLRMPMIFY